MVVSKMRRSKRFLFTAGATPFREFNRPKFNYPDFPLEMQHTSVCIVS